MTANVLPINPNLTEDKLLGGLLRWPATIPDVAEFLRPDNFRSDRGRTIYAAILDLWTANTTVDLESLANLLHKRGQIENIGGYRELGVLWDLEPTGAHAVYHAKIVLERSLLQRLDFAGQKAMSLARSPTGSAEEMIGQAESELFDILASRSQGGAVPMAKVLDEASDQVDAAMRRDDSQVGILSGFVDLDQKTAGFRPGELVIVASRPSCGKSSLALGIAHHAAVKSGLPVFFASLEMSRVEIGQRFFAMHGMVSLSRMRGGFLDQDELEKCNAAKAAMHDRPLHIDDYSTQSMVRITAAARRLKMRHGIRLIVIDYLQLIDPDDRRAKRHEQVSAISRRLKILAKDIGLPVIALSQLNRDPENRSEGKPRLSDLRESGSLEQDADTVILLYKDANNPDLIVCNVAKQRNGPTGEIELLFNRSFVRFENVAYEKPFMREGK